MGFDIVNSPWTARAGTVWGHTDKYDTRAGFFANYGCDSSLTRP